MRADVLVEKGKALLLLMSIADGIADTFGKSCETVVHEIYDDSYKVLHIRNGEVSGRKIGDTVSLLGYDYRINDFYKGKNIINYQARTSSGKLIKSTTIHAKSVEYHYSLGINYDFTLFKMMDGIIQNFIETSSEYQKIFSDITDINLEELFGQCLKEINVPLSLMGRNEKIELVKLLDQKAAFNIKNSISEVAEKLEVSRYTIYNYLKIARKENRKEI